MARIQIYNTNNSTIDDHQEAIQRLDKKIKHIDKLIKCYKWKKGIKKR